MGRKQILFIATLVLLLAACNPAQAETTPAPPATATIEPHPSGFSYLTIEAPSLKGNLTGDSESRSIYLYLPPSYGDSTKHYPVIYYLAGFTDQSMGAVRLPGDFDALMQSGEIQEMIVVVANGRSRLGGSFYVNSAVTGNWEDYITQDLIGYIDSHYRTIPNAASRGIAGHSMGGFGALNIAMRHPELFTAVYSLSPGLFDPEGLSNSQLFPSEGRIRAFIEYQEAAASLGGEEATANLLHSPDNFTLAYGLAFAPNAGQSPYFDYPFSEVDGELVRDDAIWARWESGFGNVAAEINEYRDNLLALQGIAVDVGRNDEIRWIPPGCDFYDEQLTAAGIPHEYYMHDGNHQNRLVERILDYMLPFFSDLLAPEQAAD